MEETDALMQSYRGVRVLVTGASGFVGRWVAKKLSEAGAELHLVVRDPLHFSPIADQYGIRGEVVAADLADSQSLDGMFRRIRPATSFNLAGYGVDPSERDEVLSYRLNATLPAALANCAATWRDPDWGGQNLVHAGSALEYGEATGDLRENGPVKPTTLYGISKLQGSQAVAELTAAGKLRGVVGRLFTVYGPGEHSPRLLPSLIRARRTEESLNLTQGTQRRDFTYIEDVAEGLLRLGSLPSSPGIVNLATGRLTAVREFAEIAAGLLSLPESRLVFGAIQGRASEMHHEAVSIRLLQAVTGWSPQTTVREGISRTLHFEFSGLLDSDPFFCSDCG